MLPASQSLGWANASGLMIGVWGLAVSIVGFALTMWQLQRTQSAAAAVGSAMVRLKQDFASFDVITELRTARAAGEAIQSHVSCDRWGEAFQGYNIVRASLKKISVAHGGLTSEQRGIVQDHIASCLDACTSIERLMPDSVSELSKEVLNNNLRNMDNFLIEIEFSLKDAIRAG